MGNKYLSEVIAEHKEEIFGNDEMILIGAGVGAGKNTWVQKELVKDLKDDETILLITSRKIIEQQGLKARSFYDNLKVCVENHYHFITTYQKLSKIIFSESEFEEENDFYNNAQRLEDRLEYLEKLNFKYVIIDEVHSLIADSGFADSAYYILALINYFIEKKKKVICMSATLNSLLPYFRRYGNYKYLNFTNECYNVKPQRVEIINKTKACELLSQANSNNKMIYMANSATDICNKFVNNLINNYEIDKQTISILISDSKKDSLKKGTNSDVKEMLENMKKINDYIVDTEKLPESTNLLIATSKIREGLNLTDTNIKAMFCESHNPIDIIQFSGRYRHSVDVLYIIDNSYSQVDQDNILRSNREFDFLNNVLLEQVKLYNSILIYRATKYKDKFLNAYLKAHNTNIEMLNLSMHFTNPTLYAINILDSCVESENTKRKDNKKKKTIAKPKLKLNKRKYYTYYYSISYFIYSKEWNRFKNFITDKFPLLRYNPILKKFEINNEAYYYNQEFVNAYKKYKEDPVSFIKSVLEIENVSINVPKYSITTTNNDEVKNKIKKEILKLLSDNNWLNVRLDKETQATIIAKINKDILEKPYKQLGRILSAYGIYFDKPGANKESYILIKEKFN